MSESGRIMQPRPLLPVILVLDTSDAMCGERIGALNGAMEELLRRLKQPGWSGEADVRVGVMQFGSACRWVTGRELVPVHELVWKALETHGSTALGTALKELDDMLSRQGRDLFRTRFTVYRPVIVLVSDGLAYDDWEGPLEAIRQNEWYQRAVKCAIAVGDDADAALLAQIVQGGGAVAEADDRAQLEHALVCGTIECCGESIQLGDRSVSDPAEPWGGAIWKVENDTRPDRQERDDGESPWGGEDESSRRTAPVFRG